MRYVRMLLATTLAFFVLLPVSTGIVNAADSSSFQSGRIIDDNVFFKTATLGVSDIQNFLNSQVPTCDTNGTQIYSGSETRAQYSEAHGISPPFICLKDYTTNIPAMAADSYCNGINAQSNASSAQIIYTVANACGVNPQVLIVLLQKEQGLVTDDWPWPIEYQEATGFGCPDSSSCSATYAGFFNQLYYAARQNKVYQANPNTFNYNVGTTDTVLYNPNGACGSSGVFMQTNATADLYNYTPYQPNAEALNNLYGSGDSCSSYGNRNFWRYFNDWFGPTTSNDNNDVLDFIRLNYSSGNAQSVGYSYISSYSYPARYNVTSYPAYAPGTGVVPLFWPNGDLVFVRLNYSSGNVQLVSYSASSGFTSVDNIAVTGYPDVPEDGSVIPLFQPNGNLSFIRLNDSSGNVQIVTYSASSNYKQLMSIQYSNYPAVAANSGVVPLFWPNGDLVFVRLNYSSGNVQLVSYSASSGFKQIDNNVVSAYPAVPQDGSVIPLFKPNGDLSFIRLNYSSGNVQTVTYSDDSNYQQLKSIIITGYPDVATDGSVVPLFTK